MHLKIAGPTIGLLACLMPLWVLGESEFATIDASAEALLLEWFDVDPARAEALRSTVLPPEQGIQRRRLSFTGDAGEAIEATLWLPATGEAHTGLALLMHPMGIDSAFWWRRDLPIEAWRITEALLQRDYAVVTLDARLHGQRVREGVDARRVLQVAHSPHRRLYHDLIIDTVRDHRLLLQGLRAQRGETLQRVLVAGYSMGAQMALIVAAFEPAVDRVLAMVPPNVDLQYSPVAPRHHVGRLRAADVLLIAAREDPHASQAANRHLLEQIAGPDKRLLWYPGGHLLPPAAMAQAVDFIQGGDHAGRR